MTASVNTIHRRRTILRVLKRWQHRIKKLCNAFVSPLGWLMIALTIILCVLFAHYGWHEMLAMALVLATMLILAILMSLGNTAFDATLHIAQQRINVGDEIVVQVNVSNPGKAVTTFARGDLPMGEHHERFSIPSLRSSQTKRTDITLRSTARGVLPIGPLTIRKGDPFGLMRHEKRLAERIDVYIHPIIVSLHTMKAGDPRDLEGSPSGDIVDDDLDFYGLRAYSCGDDIRNVHWLSTAKTGTMMIRQFEATRRTDTSITLDTNPDDYMSAEEFEMAVSIHASIGVQCLQQGRGLYTHTYHTHNQPHNHMELLDQCSAIEPHFSSHSYLAQSTIKHCPDASFYYFIVGRNMMIDDIRRIAMALPQSAQCLVLQAHTGMPRSIRKFSDFTLATVGNLDDLKLIMGALA